MTRLLNTLPKDKLLDLIYAQEDVPLFDPKMGTTTDAGEFYMASKDRLEREEGRFNSAVTSGVFLEIEDGGPEGVVLNIVEDGSEEFASITLDGPTAWALTGAIMKTMEA